MKILLKSTIYILMSMLLTTSICIAAANEIPKSDLQIGGIALGNTEDYVRSIYGEPTSITYTERSAFGRMKNLCYGDSFYIHLGQDGRAVNIETTADNGLKTPPGFTVGMPLAQVEEYYGDVGYVGTQQGKRIHRYQAVWGMYMMYRADKDGNIEFISVYQSP